MDVLSSRILLRPGDLDCNRRFYRDMLGLAIYREFGSRGDPGVVFFLGQGLTAVHWRHEAGACLRQDQRRRRSSSEPAEPAISPAA